MLNYPIFSKLNSFIQSFYKTNWSSFACWICKEVFPDFNAQFLFVHQKGQTFQQCNKNMGKNYPVKTSNDMNYGSWNPFVPSVIHSTAKPSLHFLTEAEPKRYYLLNEIEYFWDLWCLNVGRILGFINLLNDRWF